MAKLETHLTTVFAEDLRREIGGKITLVGVFNSVCGVPSFPAMLPKLAVMLRVFGSAESMPASIGYKAWLGEDLVAEVPLSGTTNDPSMSLTSQVEAAGEAIPAELINAGKFRCITAFLVFTPLVVERPSVLRVRAYGPDGEEYIAPALTFVVGESVNEF